MISRFFADISRYLGCHPRYRDFENHDYREISRLKIMISIIKTFDIIFFFVGALHIFPVHICDSVAADMFLVTFLTLGLAVTTPHVSTRSRFPLMPTPVASSDSRHHSGVEHRPLIFSEPRRGRVITPEGQLLLASIVVIT